MYMVLFTILALSNEITYNISRFLALYSKFIQYLRGFVFHTKFSC